MNRIFCHSILIASAVIVLGGCSKPPFSSPTALRDTNAYDKAISPTAPGAFNPGDLDQVTVSMEGSAVIISRPARTGRLEPNDGFTHVFRRLAPGEVLEGDGAVFEVLAFSVSGPGISPVPTNGSRQVPVDFFSPDGTPLTAEHLQKLGFKKWHLTEYVSDPSYIGDFFPEVKVWFGSREQAPGYFSPVGCFDARTKHPLVSGYSYSQATSNSPGHVELRPRAWHATPMDLVMDVQLDGKTMVQTNAVAKITVPVAGGFVRLIGIWDGDCNSWGSGGSSSPGIEVIRVGFRTSKEPQATAVFMTEPPGLAVHCALLNEQGKEFDGAGGGTAGGGLRMVGLKGRVEDVKWMRFTVYTNHHRVVVQVPPIPKLLAAGQNPANLFNVRVPLVKFDREYELREFVGGLTQMEFGYPPGGDMMPTNLFPMTLTNTTPAELLTLYRRNLTNTLTIVVDGQKQKIRVEPTPFEKARRWVMQKLGR